jgi:hypothetical protein
MIKLLKGLIGKRKYIKSNNPCHENNEEVIELDAINFKGESYYINGKSYYINNLQKVEYGLAGESDSFPTCYIKIYLKKGENTFDYNGFEIIDLNSFIYSMDKFNISILPTIIGSYPYAIKTGYILTIAFRSGMNQRGLIRISSEMIYQDNDFLQRFNLKKYLESTSKFNDMFMKSFDNEDFSITILDKNLTLNRGYGVYPILNNEIIIEDIFYSFDEEEIKSKIIELFEKHNFLTS